MRNPSAEPRRCSSRLVVTIALIAILAWAINNSGLGRLTGASTTTETPAIPATSADEKALVAAAKTGAATVKVDAGTDGKGYSRSQFGDGWKTVKGCDMRNRTLARDLADDVFKPGTRDCVVTGGVLAEDIYSGKRVTFVKGGLLANSLDIDHRPHPRPVFGVEPRCRRLDPAAA